MPLHFSVFSSLRDTCLYLLSRLSQLLFGSAGVTHILESLLKSSVFPYQGSCQKVGKGDDGFRILSIIIMRYRRSQAKLYFFTVH